MPMSLHPGGVFERDTPDGLHAPHGRHPPIDGTGGGTRLQSPTLRGGMDVADTTAPHAPPVMVRWECCGLLGGARRAGTLGDVICVTRLRRETRHGERFPRDCALLFSPTFPRDAKHSDGLQRHQDSSSSSSFNAMCVVMEKGRVTHRIDANGDAMPHWEGSSMRVGLMVHPKSKGNDRCGIFESHLRVDFNALYRTDKSNRSAKDNKDGVFNMKPPSLNKGEKWNGWVYRLCVIDALWGSATCDAVYLKFNTEKPIKKKTRRRG